MAYRAKSLAFNESPAQGKVQRKALKALKRSKLKSRLADVINDQTQFIAHETGLDTDKARKLASVGC